MVDRPSSAMQHQDFKGVTDRGKDAWKQEKGEKTLFLK